MSQYIPKVTKDDIDRLIRRDFPSENFDEIWQLINSFVLREGFRIIAACLKNAKGNVKQLRSELFNAECDWRDALIAAEYPKIKKASKYSKEEIYEKQKQQYLKWFNEL